MAFIFVSPEHIDTYWVAADGSNSEAVVLDVDEVTVTYANGDGKTITRDRMGFSCRYTLADDTPPCDYEDDGQPTMYEEYQDLYGGDDNPMDYMEIL